MDQTAETAGLACGSLPPLLDRDLSILCFNQRVLDGARRSDVPLMERLRYLCIVSSNLDEFFEVRDDAATCRGKLGVPPNESSSATAGPKTL